jgi:hypothetical protein
MLLSIQLALRYTAYYFVVNNLCDLKMAMMSIAMYKCLGVKVALVGLALTVLG